MRDSTVSSILKDALGRLPKGDVLEQVIETPHPYENNMNVMYEAHFPGAKELTVKFAPECKTELNCDKLTIYLGPNRTNPHGSAMSGNTWPTEPLVIPGDHLWFNFVTDASTVMWGLKIIVTGPKAKATPKEVKDKGPDVEELAMRSLVRIVINLLRSQSRTDVSVAEEVLEAFREMLATTAPGSLASLNPYLSSSLDEFQDYLVRSLAAADGINTTQAPLPSGKPRKAASPALGQRFPQVMSFLISLAIARGSQVDFLQLIPQLLKKGSDGVTRKLPLLSGLRAWDQAKISIGSALATHEPLDKWVAEAKVVWGTATPAVALGIATNGSFVFICTDKAVHRVGSGLHRTEPGRIYTTASHQFTQLLCVGDNLLGFNLAQNSYCWLNSSTLEAVGTSFSGDSTGRRTATDGVRLYTLSEPTPEIASYTLNVYLPTPMQETLGQLERSVVLVRQPWMDNLVDLPWTNGVEMVFLVKKNNIFSCVRVLVDSGETIEEVARPTLKQTCAHAYDRTNNVTWAFPTEGTDGQLQALPNPAVYRPESLETDARRKSIEDALRQLASADGELIAGETAANIIYALLDRAAGVIGTRHPTSNVDSALKRPFQWDLSSSTFPVAYEALSSLVAGGPTLENLLRISTVLRLLRVNVQQLSLAGLSGANFGLTAALSQSFVELFYKLLDIRDLQLAEVVAAMQRLTLDTLATVGFNVFFATESAQLDVFVQLLRNKDSLGEGQRQLLQTLMLNASSLISTMFTPQNVTSTRVLLMQQLEQAVAAAVSAIGALPTSIGSLTPAELTALTPPEQPNPILAMLQSVQSQLRQTTEPVFDALKLEYMRGLLHNASALLRKINRAPADFHAATPEQRGAYGNMMSNAFIRVFAMLISTAAVSFYSRALQASASEPLLEALTEMGAELDTFMKLYPSSDGVFISKEEKIDTLHPYLDNTEQYWEFTFPGCSELQINFDRQCITERTHDRLTIWDNNDVAYGPYSGPESEWPRQTLRCAGPRIKVNFHSDGSNVAWGVRMTVKGEVILIPEILSLHNLVLAMAARAATALIDVPTLPAHNSVREWLREDLFIGGQTSAVDAFYEDVVAGTGRAADLLGKLRAATPEVVPHEATKGLTTSVFSALIHHMGLTEVAKTASAPNDDLLLAWQKANEVATWLKKLGEMSLLVQKEATAEERAEFMSGYVSFVQDMCARSVFLTKFKPAASIRQRTGMSCKLDTKLPIDAARWLFWSNVNSKRSVVAEPIEEMVTRWLKDDTQYAKTSDLLDLLTATKNEAAMRLKGIESITRLLSGAVLEASIEEILENVYRVTNPDEGMLAGLEGIDADLRAALQSAYFRFYVIVISKLENITSDKEVASKKVILMRQAPAILKSTLRLLNQEIGERGLASARDVVESRVIERLLEAMTRIARQDTEDDDRLLSLTLFSLVSQICGAGDSGINAPAVSVLSGLLEFLARQDTSGMLRNAAATAIAMTAVAFILRNSSRATVGHIGSMPSVVECVKIIVRFSQAQCLVQQSVHVAAMTALRCLLPHVGGADAAKALGVDSGADVITWLLRLIGVAETIHLRGPLTAIAGLPKGWVLGGSQFIGSMSAALVDVVRAVHASKAWREEVAKQVTKAIVGAGRLSTPAVGGDFSEYELAVASLAVMGGADTTPYNGYNAEQLSVDGFRTVQVNASAGPESAHIILTGNEATKYVQESWNAMRRVMVEPTYEGVLDKADVIASLVGLCAVGESAVPELRLYSLRVAAKDIQKVPALCAAFVPVAGAWLRPIMANQVYGPEQLYEVEYKLKRLRGRVAEGAFTETDNAFCTLPPVVSIGQGDLLVHGTVPNNAVRHVYLYPADYRDKLVSGPLVLPYDINLDEAIAHRSAPSTLKPIVRVLIMGDSRTGKTTFTAHLARRSPPAPESYTPTVSETESATDGEKVSFRIVDCPAPNELYAGARDDTIARTNIFFVMFNSRDTFLALRRLIANIKSVKERPGVAPYKIIVVEGRFNTSYELITPEAATTFAQEMSVQLIQNTGDAAQSQGHLTAALAGFLTDNPTFLPASASSSSTTTEPTATGGAAASAPTVEDSSSEDMGFDLFGEEQESTEPSEHSEQMEEEEFFAMGGLFDDEEPVERVNARVTFADGVSRSKDNNPSLIDIERPLSASVKGSVVLASYFENAAKDIKVQHVGEIYAKLAEAGALAVIVSCVPVGKFDASSNEVIEGLLASSVDFTIPLCIVSDNAGKVLYQEVLARLRGAELVKRGVTRADNAMASAYLGGTLAEIKEGIEKTVEKQLADRTANEGHGQTFNAKDTERREQLENTSQKAAASEAVSVPARPLGINGGDKGAFFTTPVYDVVHGRRPGTNGFHFFGEFAADRDRICAFDLAASVRQEAVNFAAVGAAQQAVANLLSVLPPDVPVSAFGKPGPLATFIFEVLAAFYPQHALARGQGAAAPGMERNGLLISTIAMLFMHHSDKSSDVSQLIRVLGNHIVYGLVQPNSRHAAALLLIRDLLVPHPAIWMAVNEHCNVHAALMSALWENGSNPGRTVVMRVLCRVLGMLKAIGERLGEQYVTAYSTMRAVLERAKSDSGRVAATYTQALAETLIQATRLFPKTDGAQEALPTDPYAVVLSRLPACVNPSNTQVVRVVDNYRIDHTGSGGTIVTRADRQLEQLAGKALSYFEVTVVSSDADAYVTVGVTYGSGDNNRMVGMANGTCGYHADDGALYCQGTKAATLPTYKTGDVVGCGLSYNDGKVFFTKNGGLHAEMASNLPLNVPIFAAAATKTSGQSLKFNFGHEAFRFDLSTFTASGASNGGKNAPSWFDDVMRLDQLSDALLAQDLSKVKAEDLDKILNPQLTLEKEFQTPHPYNNNMDEPYEFSCPGAESLTVTFDEQCATERNYDYLEVSRGPGRTERVHGPFTGAARGDGWPTGGRLQLDGWDRATFFFHSDGSNNDWGVKFLVRANLPVDNAPKRGVADTINDMRRWTMDMDKALVQLAWNAACDLDVPHPFTNPSAVANNVVAALPQTILAGENPVVVKQRLLMLHAFNQMLDAVLPFADLSEAVGVLGSIRARLTAIRDLIYPSIIASYANASFMAMVSPVGSQEYVVSRNRASRAAVARRVRGSVLDQVYMFIDGRKLGVKAEFTIQVNKETLSRPAAISLICNELVRPGHLLQRCNNAALGLGVGQDYVLPRPGMSSPLELAWYRTAGTFLALAYLTPKASVNFMLPPLFWKTLLGVPVTLQDLEAVDATAVAALRGLRNVDQAAFESTLQQTFTCVLSDGTVVELVPGGRERKVTWAQRAEYAGLVEQALLHAYDAQIGAMREGYIKVLPEAYLKTFVDPTKPGDLLPWASEVDPNNLKSAAKYDNCTADDQHVARFWAVMTALNKRQQTQFAQLILGRREGWGLRDVTQVTIRCPAGSTDASKIAISRRTTTVDLPRYNPDVVKDRLLAFLAAGEQLDPAAPQEATEY